MPATPPVPVSSSKSVPQLWIRADGDARTGSGHLMRCLALAQHWRDRGGRVTLVTRCSIPALLDRYRREGCEVEALGGSDTSWVPRAHSAEDWLVLDGYDLDEAEQQRWCRRGFRLLAIDDLAHLPHYSAELIVNQNLHATGAVYPAGENTQILRGPAYALLRREFVRRARCAFTVQERVRRVVVTFGGTDPAGLGMKMATAAAEAGNWEVVLAGGMVPPSGAAHPRVRMVTDVDDMADLLSRADIAIAAAGTTSWELAFLGIPSLLVAVADNQRPLARELHARGAAMGFEDAAEATPDRIAGDLQCLAASPEARRKMSETASALVDGAGAERVTAAMLGHSLYLRPARPSDCRRWFDWSNDPEARRASFSSDPIPWNDHQLWYQQRLADAGVLMYVAESEGAPVGQLRYDLRGREATVSVSVDAGQRGRGLGAQVLALGNDRLRSFAVDCVHAYIRTGNEASLRAFLKNGFRRVEDTTVSQQTAMHLVRDLL